MNEEEKKWTIEGLTELSKIMYRSMIKGIDIYIESPLNFKKALDNALELLENQQKEIEELKTITRGYEAYKCEEGDKIIIADKNFFDRGIFIKKFVSIEEYNLLLKRFRHLIKSKIISSYDKTKKGKYCKDISKFDSDYISKDKIKEKAEELDNQQRQWREDRTNKHTDSQIIYARDVLEELLGE